METVSSFQKYRWHAASIEDVLAQLAADKQNGLSSAEVSRRHQQYGFNELREQPPTAFWRLVLEQFNNFIVILLIVASIIGAGRQDILDSGLQLLGAVFSLHLFGFSLGYVLSRWITKTEIVARTGRKLGTIKAQLFQARTKLKNILDGEENEHE